VYGRGETEGQGPKATKGGGQELPIPEPQPPTPTAGGQTEGQELPGGAPGARTIASNRVHQQPGEGQQRAKKAPRNQIH
jgi:hypothetical protein